ncbi:hypothetical protein GCM10027598_70880 [Amycolatopsis oliviviridis]|uniref:Uncharacterized protein n=1 Tax=Amycolatopsis oliviviridis TaxID=1471590 RepID=A0ABQ3L405_9PSEU|nr:hypothetical protein [Amycolatopsis oliviviridis]GHH01108.1 hypothetical protein GCM10017790_00810 [Amycolatopsis oliviviridis]
MWTWRRKEPGSPPESPPSGPAALPVTRAEWRSLPPIQRVVAEHPLINPVQRFSSSLTSWQSPGYLEPLGHRVGPAEPAGVIGGLARAPMTQAAGAHAPDMPVVQRSVRRRGVLSRLWGMSVQRAAEPAAPVAESPALESPAPEPESAPLAATVQPYEEPSPDEALPPEPSPVSEPSAAFVLPVVAVASREADRPSMPLTSVGPSVLSARPPVRAVQAIRSETPGSPLHTPDPAAELAPMPAGRPLADASEPDHGPIVPTPDSMASSMAPEPDLTEAEPFETVPVRTPDSLPAEPPASEVATPSSAEPSRPALPVVQRTEQIHAVPRRLGLGAPILPDSDQTPAPVLPVAEPVAEPDGVAGEPEVEDKVAEVDAPLAGAVETTVLPPSTADETSAAVPDEVPRPVARIVAGEERNPPSESRSSTSMAIQRAASEPALELPSPKHQDVPLSGASVQKPVPKPVQRLRQSDLPGETAGDTRMSEPPSSLPTVTLSRSSPSTTIQPLESTRIHTTTKEISAPPGAPGGAEHPAPAAATATSPLPVARIVDGTGSVTAPVPEAVTQPFRTPVASRPTLAAWTALTGGASAATALPELSVSRVIEAPRVTSPLPSARVLDGSTRATIQRFHQPSPPVSETPAVETVTVPPVARREDAGVLHLPPAVLPVARSTDDVEPAPYLSEPNSGALVSAGRPGLPGPLPVARIPEAVPDGLNVRKSTMDVRRLVQRTASSETVDQGDGLVLSSPAVVLPRQAETAVVQREPETPPPAPDAPPVPAPEPPATPSAAPAAQPGTEELVKKLFDPLLRRLKTELRLDRERRGALTDRPH